MQTDVLEWIIKKKNQMVLLPRLAGKQRLI